MSTSGTAGLSVGDDWPTTVVGWLSIQNSKRWEGAGLWAAFLTGPTIPPHQQGPPPALHLNPNPDAPPPHTHTQAPRLAARSSAAAWCSLRRPPASAPPPWAAGPSSCCPAAASRPTGTPQVRLALGRPWGCSPCSCHADSAWAGTAATCKQACLSRRCCWPTPSRAATPRCAAQACPRKQCTKVRSCSRPRPRPRPQP